MVCLFNSIGACKRAETTIIFAGNKGSGKSTIINRFLERNESPKPTLALDYTYGRKGIGNFLTKAVSQIWELGGGLKLSDLLGVVITPNNILSLHLILVIDLSKPEELWDTVDTLLNSVSARVDQMLNRLYQKNITRIQNTFKANLRKRIPSNHPDIELLNPFPLPLTVLGTKYDILMFCSVKDDGLLKKIKAYLNHIAFDGKDLCDAQMETGKPLMIPVGVDSFSNIGTPPNVDMEIERLTVKSPLEMWKNAFCSKFPQKSALTTSFNNRTDPSKDLQYSESLVDSALKVKHEELESKLHQNERHILNLLEQITSEGIIIA
ncbi:hypothetical protein MN116_006576 [Schistosoma mekongi]|uniref:Cytoplasmic dynein 2 light intermediate chain 1 n=1 Tax=Schistosoma mekongi TaxID=38744 RepID=A0AAE1Z9B8_SCHME|nr:hypothetical protein MN116_006576 [Schistosoma mekongi]